MPTDLPSKIFVEGNLSFLNRDSNDPHLIIAYLNGLTNYQKIFANNKVNSTCSINLRMF